ncbi:hypothetical protein LJC08_05445 [Methanimicrococcus sp. OttesenSCG-928-J09]|nr:hypothetical protein [Methanimicrococcus sp. OttesenSCG-928-J09]
MLSGFCISGCSHSDCFSFFLSLILSFWMLPAVAACEPRHFLKNNLKINHVFHLVCYYYAPANAKRIAAWSQVFVTCWSQVSVCSGREVPISTWDQVLVLQWGWRLRKIASRFLAAAAAVMQLPAIINSTEPPRANSANFTKS